MDAESRPERRTRHPYYMYDEIRLQPEAVARSLALSDDWAPEVCPLVARARRVLLTGCGTSFHAARVGAGFLRHLSAGTIDARAIQAYELVTYFPGLRPDDVVVAVTHSGTTTMTLQALDRAHRSGAETVAVTGFPESAAGSQARYVVPSGYQAELSWAHTVSYTTALASLLSLANGVAEAGERLDLSPLPEVVTDALALEEMAHRLAASTVLAERYREPPRIVLVGAGSNAVTAQEGALKLLETSYADAVAYELEEMLHGPLAAVTAETLLLVIAPSGRSTDRIADLLRAAHEIGVTPVALTGGENAERFDEAHRFILPEVPEIVSPIPSVVPLQLFSYFLAVGKGLNPDLLRRDDERYRAARAQYR
jgi:glucosamine--fructose-6-phosphate aminotransferase (isomerizing)